MFGGRDPAGNFSVRQWPEKRVQRKPVVQIGNPGDSDSAAIKLI